MDNKRRVLIVEDEPLIAMMLEDMLLDADCEIAGIATSLETGVALANNSACDFAVLDMTLGRDSSFPIADVLTSRGVPFLFASGHERYSLPQEHCHRVVLGKPFNYDQLVAKIDEATNALPLAGAGGKP